MQQIVEMSQTEYARHRGITKQAVGKRMPKLREAGAVLPNGKIDAAKADLEWPNAVERVNVPADDAPAAPAGGEAAPRDGAGSALTRAKVVTEVYAARMAELKFGKESGKYVEAAGIADAASACGERIVRMVRSLRSRADMLTAAAASGGVDAVKAALTGIEHDMLTQVASEFEKMASAAMAGAPETDEASPDGN